MRITNRSSNTVSVSINVWGSDSDGSTEWFRLAPGESDSWKRTDYRGFVMAISIRGQQNSYFIFADSSIDIYDDYVEDDGKKIKPATDRYS
ncbi:hypothetical protein ID853_13000 [Xenorhabdus sp. Vera]|uniref:hypothetical protein n=1 Tax=Xenorhabdus koppenhoeferi TaxID=351659 RepID=UPI00199162E2|nr:hypothetical protein [Xenorhabdus sp. Vera]MBD2811780.1 hypothetical protein [Xenorhabdus sp. Vera]